MKKRSKKSPLKGRNCTYEKSNRAGGEDVSPEMLNFPQNDESWRMM